MKCQACGNNYKGKRGLTTHLKRSKECAVASAAASTVASTAATVPIVSPAASTAASVPIVAPAASTATSVPIVAPVATLERWLNGDKLTGVGPYSVTVDSSAGELNFTVWSTCSAPEWHSYVEPVWPNMLLGRKRAREESSSYVLGPCATYNRCMIIKSKPLDTPRVVGRVTRAIDASTPIRVLETDEETHGGFNIYGDEILSKIRKIRIE